MTACVLMLRASTLGLSLPLPNIFAVRSCRRLHGARKGWTLPLPCGTAGSGNSSFLAATNSSTVTHLSPAIPLDVCHQRKEQVELDAPERFHIMDLQQHLRIVAEDLGEGIQGVALGALSVSSVDAKEEKIAGLSTAKGMKSTNAQQPLEEEILAALEEDPDQLSSSGQERKKIGDLSQARFVADRPAYAAGKPWSSDAVRPVEIPREALHLLRNIENGIEAEHKKYALAWRQQGRRLPSLIRRHMDVLGTTTSVDDAWDSYVFLIDTIASHPLIYSRLKCIPYPHLHRFSRLLAHNRPRTYLQYLRLLSVMTYTVHCGGVLKREQWNALIVLAASGRRKTTSEDVERAMSVFRGMKTGRLPGSSSFKMPDEYEEQLDQDQSPLDPDVYTLTTLLTIAARAMDVKDLSGVRRTLQKMRHQGLELGLDGLNACIWAYGYNNRLDIVLLIYRVLRHNKVQETYLGPDDIHDAVLSLKEESIVVEAGIIPNHITYTAVIQTLAYFGQTGAPLYASETGDMIPAPYMPSLPVYRAIFLGFARNGIPARLNRDPETPNWTLDNLNEIFDRFLALPDDTLLTHSLLDVIMSAFARTSGNDLGTMRKTWKTLDSRFGIVLRKAHSESRLAILERKLFPNHLSRPD
ncbi:hypothetical protein CPB84DRAFT_1840529 [Gymnopilus junonius]|uniref:Pentatricopeptide repeat protein n=1 Tax=Gymnopilus junonius TaxID=109634 RepID=A0A9P5TU05_GYMJU|nr:hypothetical protein CPB84DRAFT_1840529 [Gymnopilus junonius]